MGEIPISSIIKDKFEKLNLLSMEEIKEQTDLKKWDILAVSSRIPDLHATMIHQYQRVLEVYTYATRIYEKMVIKSQIENHTGETTLNLNSLFKTKEDREHAIRYTNEQIEDIYVEMKVCKDELGKTEKTIEFLKLLQSNIRTIVEYEKFRGGK